MSADLNAEHQHIHLPSTLAASRKIDVLHVTSAHPVWDTRIFVKEAQTLANAGYHVAVLGPGDTRGHERRDGVDVFTLPRPRNRLQRFLTFHRMLRAFIEACQPRALHLHDPDLLPLARHFHRQSMHVIYDVHEDYPLAILSRAWLGPRVFRRFAAWGVKRLEARSSRWLSGVVLADHQLAPRFRSTRQCVVRNYLEPAEWPALSDPIERPDGIRCVYVGDITFARGLRRMCDSIAAATAAGTHIHLDLAGPMSSNDLAWVTQHPAYKNITVHGRVDRARVAQLMARSDIALSLFEPTPAYQQALGVKITEYIASGLPIIATDTPRLRAEKLLSDALHLVPWTAPPQTVAETIERVATLPRSQTKRQDLRQVVTEHYGWPSEAARLLSFYETVLGPHLTAVD